jgi:hypothetical protein
MGGHASGPTRALARARPLGSGRTRAIALDGRQGRLPVLPALAAHLGEVLGEGLPNLVITPASRP